ncbi:hypothetical protein B6I21_02150 [candidate division KSB1 bacterium 4572_119]|nr:MAG: hypothetical protein B6I21_02150 [candidate division KSB1 bacterium 4572_119]
MNWKNIILTIAVFGLTVGSNYAEQKTKKPNYYKSSISSRFVKSKTDIFDEASQRFVDTNLRLQVELPETLKVLALRVQFQKDNDRHTTGNGWFDMTQPDSLILNSPPHGNQYFSSQLLALKHYYESVSNGKLILDITEEAGNTTVYPQPEDSVWTLSQPMDYYNPNTTEEALDMGLAELFRDGIEIADANSNLKFSQFDVIIIFHAGVGWEFSQEFDTTPNDIPSVFINFADLQNTIGKDTPGFQGIEVNDGSFFVREGIILPETENQGGYEFGLLGTAAIMFGHQLGLPNLFDTDTGRPAIGRFGLMDQGSGSFYGLIPVQPCAWSKIFLGWEEAAVITSGTGNPVAASLAQNPNKIYKIPINAKEYFLIENRQKAVLKSREIAIGYDENGARIEFNDQGEINLPTGLEKLGVIVEIDEYDFGLPGSGIVIWHIDENVIEENYVANRVNVDMHHRGVDVVEADGAQDIGYFFNFFGITGFESGGAYDMWWDNNEDNLYANSSETVRLTPNTMPSSLSHSGANTGIYITDFSEKDSVMSFSVEVKRYYSGFPVFLGENSGSSPVVSCDLNGDQKRELIAATENGKILVWQSNGEKYIPNNEKAGKVDVNGDTTFFPLAVFAEAENDQFFNAPSAVDLNGDGKSEVIAASENGWLYVWEPVDRDADGYADLLFSVDCLSKITTAPVIGDFNTGEAGFEIALGLEDGNVCVINKAGTIVFNLNISQSKITGIAGFIENGQHGIVAATAEGTIYRLDENGSLLWQNTLFDGAALNYPVLADLNKDNELEIVISSDQGDLMVLDRNGDPLSHFRQINVGCPLSNPVVADVDFNGYLDVVLIGGGKVFAFNHTGVTLTNFPVLFEREAETDLYADPVIVDFDDDNMAEIIISTKNNTLLAFDSNGKKMQDFPLSLSGVLPAQVGVADLNNNLQFNVFARTDDDYCYVWELPLEFESSRVYWGEFLKDAEHNPICISTAVSVIGQGDLMPAKSVYNYPNPTEGNNTAIRYYLKESADVDIRIYDMAGELISQLPGTGYPEIDNEVTWDITDVQSGVYLARVRAESARETNTVIIKIAVIK